MNQKLEIRELNGTHLGRVATIGTDPTVDIVITNVQHFAKATKISFRYTGVGQLAVHKLNCEGKSMRSLVGFPEKADA